MKLTINGEEYEYLTDIVKDDSIRNDFLTLIYDTFEWDFHPWYNLGYWTSKYEPHVLIKNGQVVSTITVNYMKYLYKNKIHNYIQIGGVLTREEYKNRGLSRYLMEKAVSDLKDLYDQIFLFSDDVAMNFYPKMGFSKVLETVGYFVLPACNDSTIVDKFLQYNPEQNYEIHKLQVKQVEDRELLIRCYKHGNPFSCFQSIDCEELVVFYGLMFKKDCYYYFPDQDMILIGYPSFEEQIFYLDDIYGKYDNCTSTDDFQFILKMIQSVLFKCGWNQNDAIKIKFGFSLLKEFNQVIYEPLIMEDDTTFMIKGKEDIITSNQLSFPVLSHN